MLIKTQRVNTNSPHAYKKSEFDVFGIVGKLVIYLVHSFKRKKYLKIFFFPQSAQIASDQFLIPRILWVNSYWPFNRNLDYSSTKL
jgi:hypothetical protein